MRIEISETPASQNKTDIKKVREYSTDFIWISYFELYFGTVQEFIIII